MVTISNEYSPTDTRHITVSPYIIVEPNLYKIIFIIESVQEHRAERLAEEELTDPTRVEKLRLNANVLERNLSPSLQPKT